MANFIATVGPAALRNWEICKRERLWGVMERRGMPTGAAQAKRVTTGDYIFIWLGAPPSGRAKGGVKALVQATGPFNPVPLRIPWPDPQDYAGVIPIRVISELNTPVGDSFSGPKRTSVRFGIQNIALIHGFRELDDNVAAKIKTLFP
jgi:hypothetical protein